MAWKAGHKKKCSAIKTERKTKRKTDVDEARLQRAQEASAVPVDATLDPAALFSEGQRLVVAGEHAEGAWLFLVTLFLDWSYDLNKDWFRRAASGCGDAVEWAHVLDLLAFKTLPNLAKRFGFGAKWHTSS